MVFKGKIHISQMAKSKEAILGRGKITGQARRSTKNVLRNHSCPISDSLFVKFYFRWIYSVR